MDSTTGGIQRMNDRAGPSSDSQPANRIDRVDSAAESKMIEVLRTARCRQMRPIGNDAARPQTSGPTGLAPVARGFLHYSLYRFG